MKHALEGARVRFLPGRPVAYFQDFSYRREPLPSDRDFRVRSVTPNGSAWLEAFGYGLHGQAGSYGCGAIAVQLRREEKA